MQESEADKERKTAKRPWLKPTRTMLAVTLITAAVLLVALRKDPYSSTSVLVIGFSSMIGVFAGWFHARRFGLLLAGIVFGLAVGIFSSLDFLKLPVEGAYAVVFATLVVYVFIGLILGGFAESVRFLHFVAHGGKPRDYRS